MVAKVLPKIGASMGSGSSVYLPAKTLKPTLMITSRIIPIFPESKLNNRRAQP